MSRPLCPALDPGEQDLEFQVVDWYIPESDRHLKRDFSAEPMVYQIYMFGVTAEGYSVCARVKGFEPYFFIKCPASWYKNPNGTDKTLEQLRRSVSKLKNSLLEDTYETYVTDRNTGARTKVKKNIIPYRLRSHLLFLKLVWRKDFWGFTNGTNFPFMKLKVKSLGLYNILRRYFQERIDADKLLNKSTFELYESNIDPFLRFIHEQDIQPCGWVKCPAMCYEVLDASGDGDGDSSGGDGSGSGSESGAKSAPSRASINVEVESRYVVPLNYNKIAPLYIASFDIECSSAHGDFPLAKKTYFKLAQDIVRAYVFARPTRDQLHAWIAEAFERSHDPHPNARVYQVFPKAPLHVLTNLQDRIAQAAGQAYDVLDASDLNIDLQVDAGDDDADDEDAEAPKPIGRTQSKHGIYERQVCDIFNRLLPPLRGDSIIQIGTTVHVYGSDEIVYRNIVTLNTCDEIEGAEVQAYSTEEKMLMAWKNVIASIDPDIMVGYNTFGFDMQYIWTRVQELGITREFADGLGRLLGREAVLEEKKLSSSALGDNIMYVMQLHGVVNIDMYKVMQRDQKLDSYKLDDVAAIFLGDKKHDVSPQEIFSKFRGTSGDRCEIARYCLQDCALVNRLVHKLKVLENNVGMGNVCSVPLSYLFMRGQGVKIFSLVAKECRNKQYVIPAKKYMSDQEAEDEDGYEGAIVLEPKEGMYLDEAITVFDYASLYPSSMIERNLSHDALLIDPAYANLEDQGITYKTVSYDVYETDPKTHTKRAVGQKSCVFAQLPDGKKGIIPTILQKLLDARKTTRKKIEYETLQTADGKSYTGLVKDTGEQLEITDLDAKTTVKLPSNTVVARRPTFQPFEQAVLDALQLAYKITANSLYGQIGARTSPIYLKDIAACTTATGRERIQLAKKFMEDKYQAEVIYGDSVTSYTPVYVRKDGVVQICTIEDVATLYGDSAWIPCREAGRQTKEACELHGVETWSDKGWTPLHRVIRHTLAPHKKIVRVRTQIGVVDVTDDHSLLAHDGSPLTSKDVIIGETELLHHSPPENTENGGELAYDTFVTSTQLAAAQFMHRFGQAFSIEERCGNYVLAGSPSPSSVTPSLPPHVISAMAIIPYEGFVYDLTTENHHFAAGVGQIIVHNTDSIFCKFPHKDEHKERVYGPKTLEMGIKKGQEAAKAIKAILPPPQSLEYEKTLYPFIIFSKKRYVGNLYEDDHRKKPKQKSMGIVLRRRDNAPIVKKVFGGIIDILLNKQDLRASVDFLKSMLQKLVAGEIPLEDLIISKTLKADYKDPTKIAHKVLAERIGEREPGNKPQINDRIPYVYIVPPADSESNLQGDRIESPSFIRANNLKPDFRFYITNQIQKPVCQLYALCVEKLPEYDYPADFWTELEERLSQETHYQDPKKRKKRMTDLRMRMAEEILFEPFLLQLPEHKPKKRTMAQFLPGARTAAQARKSKAKPEKARLKFKLPEPPPGEKRYPLLLEFQVQAGKGKGAGYKGTYTITQQLESENVVIAQEELSSPKIKNMKKPDMERRWMQHVFDLIGQNPELHNLMRRHGLRFKVSADVKRLMTAAMRHKDAILSGQIYQQMQEMAKSTDVAASNDMGNEITFNFVVFLLEKIRFEFV